MRRTKEDAKNTRNKILESALEIFWNNGYTLSSLESICSHAKLTRGALYWHFPEGKKEILQTLLLEKGDPGFEFWKFLKIEEGSAKYRLEGIMTAWFKALNDNSEYRKVMELTLFKIECTTELEEGMKQKQVNIQMFRTCLSSIINTGIIAKEFRADLDSDTVAFACICVMMGSMQLWLLNSDKHSVMTEGEKLVSLFIKGITYTCK